MKNYKISIPKPCHEDWNKMTTNEKGRFCGSCAKTVVDFTEKSAKEIQEFFTENKGKRICGHFKRKQLDSIVIQIPETTFVTQLSFQKLFLLALLFVMGTTLFSCKTDEGKKQKIEKVELIDTIIKTQKVLDTIKVDTIIKAKINIPPPPKPLPVIKEEHTTMGLPIAAEPATLCKNDSIVEVVEIMGDISHVEDGEVVFEEIQPYSFNIVEIPPKFKDTTSKNKEEAKIVFHKKMNAFVTKNFDTNLTTCLGLDKKKYRILARFIIDATGNISDIKVRAPHLKLQEHTKELLQKLPQFIPGQQNGKNVSVRYVLPISFVVE